MANSEDRPTHNPLVPDSSPGGPTTSHRKHRVMALRPGDRNPLVHHMADAQAATDDAGGQPRQSHTNTKYHPQRMAGVCPSSIFKYSGPLNLSGVLQRHTGVLITLTHRYDKQLAGKNPGALQLIDLAQPCNCRPAVLCNGT